MEDTQQQPDKIVKYEVTDGQEFEITTVRHKILIDDGGGATAAGIIETLGGIPTVTITVQGEIATGKSTIAGIIKNSIKKHCLENARFKNPARILIQVEQ